MKMYVFLIFLVFNLGLSAEITENKDFLEIKCADDAKNVVRAQVYYKDGSLKANLMCRTDFKKGTYTEYYKNGNLKFFKIVS